ncbi:energy-coupling factor ABC transporter permease [Phytomonospora endophytica]|uniref:Cobalt/nickel transport system permease protein n=1 Tax=Phytomonospora endophytica TaxID=714109 RepID=A0A841FBA7_9ACTN|nr:energy-coupling factor ABC transporter permease [Phytomonospora endophytica]MBB6033064.1 cobalt/nickel transport system permease protein [Phytomonospora endophytica]GIG65291.1 cobalamin biosynthesis protein CbiM [Phytomonospora endophytica]
MDTVAMHISNGIVDPATSAVFAAIALAGMIVCVLRGRRDLDDRLAPMAGLVAAFIFAVQMLNFPVLPGVSGHLLGGALAAMLVGPWVGALCVTIVLIVQALVFADGGVSAIGLNVTNMALIGTFLTYGVLALLLKVLPRTATGVAVTGFVAAVVSVVAGSLGFVLQYAIGGQVDGISLGGAAGAMVGVHALIGVGEGLITAATVLAVAKVRPDLVYALRGKRLLPSTPKSTVESAA